MAEQGAQVTLAIQPMGEVLDALEHAPIGALLVDASGVISWANAAGADLLGEPEPASLRHTLLDVRLGTSDAETLQQMLKVHFSVPDETRGSWMRPLTVVGADGAAIAVELTLASCPGAPAKALVFLSSLARLAVAEKRFAQIFEGLPLALIVVDARQRIVQANSALAEIFGHTQEEVVGQPLSMLLPDRYRETHGGHVRSYAAEPRSRMMGSGRDLTGLHRSGKEFPVEIALTRLENASQPLFMAIVSDISQRKRAESALQQTNAQLEEFTYVASHDLRSPLRGIGDLVSWIREDLAGDDGEESLPESVRHNFDRISLRISRCEQMIDDLLQYARAGVRDPHMDRIDPLELIEEAMGMALIPDSFEVEIDIVGGTLFAPRAPLSTSLRNLISNAVKHHGGRTGHIRIAMREEGRFSIFTVEDDGQGIAAGNEERIFKLFHRASPGTEGDGVGLAFTRRMINAHGGMITVEGRGKLGGASFRIHWPRILLREQDDD